MEMTDINDDCDDDDNASIESGEMEGQIDSRASVIVGDVISDNGHGIESIKEAISFVKGWDWTMTQQQRVCNHLYFTLYISIFLFWCSNLFFCRHF